MQKLGLINRVAMAFFSEERNLGEAEKRDFAKEQKQAMEMPGYGKHGKPRSRLSTLPTPLGNPCGDSHITTAAATTIMYLKTGKARRKPAIRATLTARGL